jgi:hypothetical protein
MLITDTLSYADLFNLLEAPQQQLSRSINPTIYSTSEWIRKIDEKHHFITNVMNQDKIFLIGTEDELRQLR